MTRGYGRSGHNGWPADRLRPHRDRPPPRREPTGTAPTRRTLPTGEIEERFRLPRDEARALARDYLRRFPKEGYGTTVTKLGEDDGDIIDFAIRRMPTAD